MHLHVNCATQILNKMLVEKKEDEMKTKKEKPPSLMTQQRARQTIPSIAAEQNIAIFC